MSKQFMIAILIFFASLFLLAGLFIAIRERVAYRGRIRDRLQASKQKRISSEAELLDIRQGRSLGADGQLASPLLSLNKLLLQSGSTMGVSGAFLLALAFAGAGFFIAYLGGTALYLRVLFALLMGIVMPVLVLRAMRDGRQRKFEAQLPEAIDTVRAGHAISVAIASVAKNMPDPIGAEFRIAAAEMTYGLDLESAMANLHARVGQPDLGLIAVAVSIQSKTGGNLAEVLSNLSRVIRERFKLRRKAIALAAEGRISAMILSALPVLLFVVIRVLSPAYYGEVWDAPLARSVLTGAALWMLAGNYIMYRMVRIRV